MVMQSGISRKPARFAGLLLFVATLAYAATAPAQTQPKRPVDVHFQGQTTLPLDVRAQVDVAATAALAKMGVPSASIAVVKDGQIAYLQTYGESRIESQLGPRMPVRPSMRYSIGSISKQFTATAILMLAEQGKLSLDDKVSKFLPALTRANEISIRQILSHTSGYQDFWPQDYVPPFMTREVTAGDILDRWARKPLDFDPGTKWQYSNTGFVIAGLIIEKASGMPLLQFLQEKIFAPLEMKSVLNVDRERLGDTDATGYTRYALGPLRIAPKEGKGWLFAAGELAMTPEDLAEWDMAMIEQRLLAPASYKEMQTPVKLTGGQATGYGLGIGVGNIAGHRALTHGGGVSGFITYNIVLPDDKAAVVVFTNSDATDAASPIARKIAALLFEHTDAAARAELMRVRAIFEALQQGKIDRSQFTDNANSHFSAEAVRDFASSLGPLGVALEFNQVAQQDRGGMTFRAYRAAFLQKSVVVTVRAMPDGKIEQYQVSAAD